MDWRRVDGDGCGCDVLVASVACDDVIAVPAGEGADAGSILVGAE